MGENGVILHKIVQKKDRRQTQQTKKTKSKSAKANEIKILGGTKSRHRLSFDLSARLGNQRKITLHTCRHRTPF